MRWDIVLLLLGILLSLFAIKYARHSWLDPVPSLDINTDRLAKAIYLKVDDGRYILRLNSSVSNISEIPALIEKISIDGIALPPRPEAIKITTSDGKEQTVNVGSGSGLSTRGKILKPGEEETINVKVVFNKRPHPKIRIKINTPNRNFKAAITNIRELSKDDFFDFL